MVAHPATLVTLGDLKLAGDAVPLGFVLIVALNYRKIVGGTLIGILGSRWSAFRSGWRNSTALSQPPSLAPTFLQLDFSRRAELAFLSSCSASC